MAQISEDRKAILKLELNAWHNGTTGPLKDYGPGSINNGRKGWLPPTAGEPTGTWEANTPLFDIDGEADYTARVEAPRGSLLNWRNNIGGTGQGSATEDSTNPFGMDAARFNVLKAGAGYPWAWSWTTVDNSVGTQMVDDTWVRRGLIDDDTQLSTPGGLAERNAVKDLFSNTFHDGTADHRGIIRQSNTTYGFTSNTRIDMFVDAQRIYYASNTGYGVWMRKVDIDRDGRNDTVAAVELAPASAWWDIAENHMTTANGDSLISGSLDSSVVSRTASNTSGHEIGSGHLMTFIYSGANAGIGLAPTAPWVAGSPQIFWTQNTYSENANDPNPAESPMLNSSIGYNDGRNHESLNVEGDIIYVTYNLEGDHANDYSWDTNPNPDSTLLWEDEDSDPRIIEDWLWRPTAGVSNTNASITLRGAILWNANTAPGNTNINFPIRINSHVGFPGYHS